MILRRRSQLLSWLEKNAPTASIRRAVGSGSVEFLGWFKQLVGSAHPGWIVQAVCPITGKVWDIVIRKRLDQLYYHVWILFEDIPWHTWNPHDSENPFMQGDQPEVYIQRRENAKTQRRSEVHQENDAS